MINYIFPFSLSMIYFVTVSMGGILSYSTIIFAFVLIPIIDSVTTPKNNNQKSDSTSYDFILYLYFIVHFLTIFITLFYFDRLNLFIAAISCGVITGGIGITFAHELCHRKEKFHKLLADLLLSSVYYSHFAIEHVKGHHRNVATPNDPASARFNESIYSFFPRTLIGSFKSAWSIQTKELVKNGKKTFSLDNRFLKGIVISIFFTFLAYLIAGVYGIYFFLIQSIVAFSLLELVNYVEHYGLSREKNGDRYEKTMPWHSWNSNHRFSNALLINLQRHSHHHYDVRVKYQNLTSIDDALQLPFGYPTMILIALFPPLWKRIIHPIILGK